MGFSIGTKGYIGTGESAGRLNDFWEYSPTTDSWSQKENFGGGLRRSAVGFSIGSNGYIGTGSSGKAHKDLWQYNTSAIQGKEYATATPNDAVNFKDVHWNSALSELSSNPFSKINLIATKTTIQNNNVLEFGQGISKENNAGKIGYQTFSGDALDIIGAGQGYPYRKIKLFDRLYFENIMTNRKIVLWETDNNNHQFFGFGIESGTLRYQVAGGGNVHRFYAGTSATTSNLLMTIFDDGNVTIAGALTQNSDATLKKNILPISSSVSSILALQGYHYQWKDGFKDQNLQSGFLAQEVEKIYPHLVSKDEKGLRSVNYIGLMPYMVEEMKELNTVLLQTQTKNKELEEKNKNLELDVIKIELEMKELLNRLNLIESKLNKN